jgi:hypothetical protein
MNFLIPEASLLFLETSQMSHYAGLIAKTHLIARFTALCRMCDPNDPTGAFVEHVLGLQNLEFPYLLLFTNK